jgi:adenylate cyclase
MNVGKVLQRFITRTRVVLLRGTRLPTYLGLLVTFFVQWLFTTQLPTLRDMRERLDNVVYDQRFNVVQGTLRGNEHNIVIVDFDQKSLQIEGQWPWSRFKLGNLVTELAELGALVIGFDVFFPEYERNLVQELQQRVSETEAYADSAETLLPQLENVKELMDGDRYFADSMQATDVVLGLSFRADEGGRNGILPEPIFRIDEVTAESISLPEQQGYVGNIDVLQQSASGAGFFDTRPDIDGIIRRSPLFMQFQNRLYPSIALDMARLYYFETEFAPEVESDLTRTYQELRGIRMGQILIPTDEQGRVLVPYIGPSGSYPYISATDVLRGTLTDTQKEMLFNSLVLIGTTATGLYDLRATPVQAVYPGVEVHANVLNALLSSAPSLTLGGEEEQGSTAFSSLRETFDQDKLSPFPNRPDWETGAVYVAIILIGLALSVIYPHLGPALLALSSVTFMVGLTALNFQLWSRYNLDISLVILLVLILLITIVNMTYGFLREGLNKKVIKGMFDQYVPPAHIDAMLNNPDKYNFDGESKELSVLFSDIRNFTTISEKLSAVELKSMLNEFFTPITGVIFDHHGTIDKYVGDMVMAFWGAPIDDPAHHSHAVMAGLKMLEKVEELKPVFKAKGLPEVNIGIGINSGMMNVGDMGSTFRRSYTVLGDAVNLGSRLEGITKAYGVKLLIGEQTYQGLQGILCRQVDRVQVKGKEEPICIYQPLCPEQEATPELLAFVAEYHRAYEHYLKQEWDAAESLFGQLQLMDPATQLYAIYLQRIAELRKQKLPEKWDGTFRFKNK